MGLLLLQRNSGKSDVLGVVTAEQQNKREGLTNIKHKILKVSCLSKRIRGTVKKNRCHRSRERATTAQGNKRVKVTNISHKTNCNSTKKCVTLATTEQWKILGPPQRHNATREWTCWIISIIHTIHRLRPKLSDWLKEGHMTWIIFDNVHVWKLTHVCYFLLFHWLSMKLKQLQNLELDSLLSRFYGSVRTKKSMNGVYKTNIDCSFIQEMVGNYCTSVKFNLGLFASALWALVNSNSRPRFNFTSGTIIFHHSPHVQSIFCI